MLGSHLDTVPGAGAFDGILGVVAGIAVAGIRPALPMEVVGFSEEEGVRFGMPFIGSRALAGTLDEAVLAQRDSSGVTVAEAIRSYGLDPEGIPAARLSPHVFGYLEIHIEQGPVLDSASLPLGVVEAIVGQSRFALTFEGSANHAGTTPMNMRRDALAAAAEWIARVEAFAGAEAGLVATVGALDVTPNAGNVIPGRVRASLDVRHASDEIRCAASGALLETAATIAARRRLDFEYTALLDQPAVEMDTALTDALADAVASTGYPMHRMTSGAGHDAMVLAPHVPSAMLFLRSPGGISHHPDESVLAEDVAAALEAVHCLIAKLEGQYV
jgi:allantoate deiminase